MSFLNLLKNNGKKISELGEYNISKNPILENNQSYTGEKEKPEIVLRRNGFKIKLVTPTAFGVQIDFAKNYEQEKIKEALKNFNIKIKDKSVFVVD